MGVGVFEVVCVQEGERERDAYKTEDKEGNKNGTVQRGIGN